MEVCILYDSGSIATNISSSGVLLLDSKQELRVSICRLYLPAYHQLAIYHLSNHNHHYSYNQIHPTHFAMLLYRPHNKRFLGTGHKTLQIHISLTQLVPTRLALFSQSKILYLLFGRVALSSVFHSRSRHILRRVFRTKHKHDASHCVHSKSGAVIRAYVHRDLANRSG